MCACVYVGHCVCVCVCVGWEETKKKKEKDSGGKERDVRGEGGKWGG